MAASMLHALCLLLFVHSTFALLTFSSNSYVELPMVTVPSTCEDGTLPAVDVVIYNYPYSFAKVVAAISDFGDLAWSGNPPNTVALNGSDNTVGTARQYSLSGLSVIETLITYTKPFLGFWLPFFPQSPYEEYHTTAQIQFGDVRAYMPLDGERVTPMCNGRAAQLNMTTYVCSNQPTVAAGLLHSLHYQDAVTLSKMLGGQNFTDCQSLPGFFSSPWPAPRGPQPYAPQPRRPRPYGPKFGPRPPLRHHG